jgi:peptide/nickel transport system substrate-binding protein
MNSNRNIFLLALTVVYFFVSCGNHKSTGEDKTARSSDSVKYVKIADANNVLPAWSKENTVIYQWIAEPDLLHPTNGISFQKTEVFLYTQMFLVIIDFRTLELMPNLVKTLPEISPDGLRVTFELRTEPKWDNGEALSVDDVIFTAKASKCPFTDNPNFKPYWDNLKTIEKDSTNPLKFTAIMKQPYMHNVAFWGDYPLMQCKYYDPGNVLAKFSFEQFDDPKSKLENNKELKNWVNEFNSAKYGRDVNYLKGLGPYKVASWEAGQTLTLVRKENYWGNADHSIYESSYPEKIIFKVNRDANSQVLEFKSQADDASTTVSTKTLVDLQSDSSFNDNYNSMFTDSYNYSYIGMNMKPDGLKHKKLFTDKNVRRAIALLMPIDDINRILNKGKNKRSVGPVSFLKPDFNKNLKPLPNDIEQAKKLLNDAGWKDSDGDNILDKIIDGEKVKMEFTFNYLNTQVEWKDMATMVADAFFKSGIKANLNPLDYPAFIGNSRSHDFDMILASWGQSSTPEDFTQIWHTSSWTSSGSNFTGFGNAVTDALIDSVKYTLNDSLRNEMSKRFQQIVYDEQPYVFLFATLRRNIIHKRFGNQELYFERPGVMLNCLKLLTGSGVASHVNATQ